MSFFGSQKKKGKLSLEEMILYALVQTGECERKIMQLCLLENCPAQSPESKITEMRK